MNTDNLHALINRYEGNYTWINDVEHNCLKVIGQKERYFYERIYTSISYDR